jgi:hypothetical protein
VIFYLLFIAVPFMGRIAKFDILALAQIHKALPPVQAFTLERKGLLASMLKVLQNYLILMLSKRGRLQFFAFKRGRMFEWAEIY